MSGINFVTLCCTETLNIIGRCRCIESKNKVRLTTMSTKMRIACIGWGSLIWNCGALPVAGDWQVDGPALPVEFARESRNGRMTLVICEGVAEVPTQWSLLDTADLQAAISALAEREGIKGRVDTDIGFVDAWNKQTHGACASLIESWALANDLSGVVWTNLPCGFRRSRSVMPSGEEVLAHLRGLEGDAHEAARDYVVRAPREIDTAYRRLIEASLGWSSLAQG
ncbi:hypothetical protein KTD55_32545 [Burkholderia gladioli]|uniref:hypothetical protein n=1 Tax=Burkholderia gladioli TaxID=28095 RepID=UPI001C248A34|nr:hypothetical protein [Burkholderia gladioli]MBU9218791.1 hypothetical protein [Burkholderia gladioli]MDN7728094.1 hypothetical protein [Burkholderia gladioli]